VKAVEVISDKTGQKMMVFIRNIICFADRGHNKTELHLVHRGVFKIRLSYDKMVEMLTTEKQLTYFTTEDYVDENTVP